MKSTLRTTTAVLLFFLSFNAANAQKITTALQFNDYMVSITDTLYSYGTEWGQQFNVAFKSKDFTSLAPARIKLEEFTGKKLLEVTTMKDIGGSENLRAAMLEFIVFEKQFTGEYFSTIEKFDSKSTDDEIQKALDNLAAGSKKEEVVLKKVREAQKDYAKKNGFTIEGEEAGN